MKKSELYRAAQLSVLKDDALDAETKLDLIYLLKSNETLETYVEKVNAEKEAQV